MMAEATAMLMMIMPVRFQLRVTFLKAIRKKTTPPPPRMLRTLSKCCLRGSRRESSPRRVRVMEPTNGRESRGRALRASVL